MSLSKSAKFYLRGLGQKLDAQVRIGKEALSEDLLGAVAQALEAHELVKVRYVAHKDERKELSRELAERLGAELVDVVGHVAVLYRVSKVPGPDGVSAQVAKLK
jgi:RNA-binding protein